MSFQTFFVSPSQEHIQQIWNASSKTAAGRLNEIRQLLKEEEISCVWVRWPHWYNYPRSVSTLYIPAKISRVDSRVVHGKEVPCLHLEHDFGEANAIKAHTVRADLVDCHFIEAHGWSSDALEPYRRSTREDIYQRFKRIQDDQESPSPDWQIMKRISSEMAAEESTRHRSLATPPPSQSQSSSSTSRALLATPSTPRASSSAQNPQATGASTLQTPASSSASASFSNRLKRSLQDTDGTSDEEDRSPTKRPNSSARRQAPLPVKQEDHQASPEPPAPVAEAAGPNEQVAKLTKAKEGINKAKMYLAATDAQAKALEEQVKIDVGEDSATYFQARGLIMQLQRIKADLAQLATGLE